MPATGNRGLRASESANGTALERSGAHRDGTYLAIRAGAVDLELGVVFIAAPGEGPGDALVDDRDVGVAERFHCTPGLALIGEVVHEPGEERDGESYRSDLDDRAAQAFS